MSTLISEAYKAQNRQLHEEGHFGFRGHAYGQAILDIASAIRSTDILDYGCGQHTLQKTLPFPIKEYDPCIPGFDTPPAPSDVVVCTDVLEHVEPECLDAVLDDLKRVTRLVGFLSIEVRPAQKTLPDGRNAHLIQEPATWWFPKLFERWSSVQMNDIFYNSKTVPGLVKKLGFYAIVKDKR
jgi:hypothetical protein